MKVIKNKFIKMYAVLITAFAITSFCISCFIYPPFYPYDDCSYNFVVKGDINGDGTVDENEVVPGIKITGKGYKSSDSKITNEFGAATLVLKIDRDDDCGTFIFEDVDGSDNNGFFNTKTIHMSNFVNNEQEDKFASSIELTYYYDKVYEIYLSPKTE